MDFWVDYLPSTVYTPYQVPRVTTGVLDTTLKKKLGISHQGRVTSWDDPGSPPGDQRLGVARRCADRIRFWSGVPEGSGAGENGGGI